MRFGFALTYLWCEGVFGGNRRTNLLEMSAWERAASLSRSLLAGVL